MGVKLPGAGALEDARDDGQKGAPAERAVFAQGLYLSPGSFLTQYSKALQDEELRVRHLATNALR